MTKRAQKRVLYFPKYKRDAKKEPPTVITTSTNATRNVESSPPMEIFKKVDVWSPITTYGTE